MKRYIRSSKEASKGETSYRNEVDKIIRSMWRGTDDYDSPKKDTMEDFLDSDYESLSAYIEDHKDQIFDRDFVEEKIWDVADNYRDPDKAEQEMMKIYDKYSDHDFIQTLRIKSKDKK